jgi:hypothetical protein
MHEGTYLGQRHGNICLVAIRLCYVAEGLHRMYRRLYDGAALHVNEPDYYRDPTLLHSRLAAAIELLLELMHFAASFILCEPNCHRPVCVYEPGCGFGRAQASRRRARAEDARTKNILSLPNA